MATYVPGAWFLTNEEVFHGLLFSEDGTPRDMRYSDGRLTLDLLVGGERLLCVGHLNGNAKEVTAAISAQMRKPTPCLRIYGQYRSENLQSNPDRQGYVKLHALSADGYHIRL